MAVLGRGHLKGCQLGWFSVAAAADVIVLGSLQDRGESRLLTRAGGQGAVVGGHLPDGRGPQVQLAVRHPLAVETELRPRLELRGRRSGREDFGSTAGFGFSRHFFRIFSFYKQEFKFILHLMPEENGKS